MAEEIDIQYLGRVPYGKALEMQHSLREKRMNDKIPDTVLLLEHEHVYTQGRDNIAREELIKQQLPAPLFEVERGGKITYHGPGQLVGYFIFKFPRSRIGDFVTAIEDLTIDVAKALGVEAYSRKSEVDAYGKNIRGAWCLKDDVHRKIAAQGVETKLVPNQEAGNDPLIVTMHGFAFNVNTDLRYFSVVHPCGFTYDVMTSSQDVLGRKVPFLEVKDCVEKRIRDGFWER